MSLFRPKQETFFEKLADYLMMPVMYLLQLNISEIPQRTHFWNNTKYSNDFLINLDADQIVTVEGDIKAVRRWFGWIPIFHMPIIGGWKKFVVIKPKVKQDIWFIGWVTSDVKVGVSHIALDDNVRLLVGDGSAQFFGLNEHGDQIQLEIVGYGRIGKAKEFRRVVLL